MIDIVDIPDGRDLGVADTLVPKAKNILSVQLGSLEYQKDFGVDIAYFLTENFAFQNESFKSYLVQSLANRGVTVTELNEIINQLFSEYRINIASDDNGAGFIAR